MYRFNDEHEKEIVAFSPPGGVLVCLLLAAKPCLWFDLDNASLPILRGMKTLVQSIEVQSKPQITPHTEGHE